MHLITPLNQSALIPLGSVAVIKILEPFEK